MARGSKDKHTSKKKRQSENIEKSHKRGGPIKEAQKRAYVGYCESRNRRP